MIDNARINVDLCFLKKILAKIIITINTSLLSYNMEAIFVRNELLLNSQDFVSKK